MPGLDARGAGHRDRRAHAVPPIRRLVAGVRVATRLDVADAGTAGRGFRGGADERGECQRADEDCEEGPRSHACVVGGCSACLRSLVLAIRFGACGVLSAPAYNAARWRRPRTAARPSRSTPGARTSTSSAPERTDELFSTISGIENEPLSTPENVDVDHARDLGYPGEYPFTRGVYPSMYRGRLWTMRQFAGFGTAGGDERALPLPHGARADRPLDRLRHADAHGLRLRPRALARRGRSRRASPSTRSPTWRRSSAASRSATSRRR